MRIRITDLPAYKRINEKFETGEFEQGTKSALTIYLYDKSTDKNSLTPGHFVSAISYCKIHFSDIPEQYLTRDFFVNALSSVHKDVVNYVKANLGTKFDRSFFKDYIATNKYALEFEENCFEYMPLDYIDEEMVSCAMLAALKNRYAERRGDFDDWFYSVARRKPEVLTQDFWTLGARLFAMRKQGKNRFLSLTPEHYKTREYYFAMCLENDSPVMEDFPEEVITTDFLFAVISSGTKNIRTFSAQALEREAPLQGKFKKLKFWQAAILLDGFVIKDIPLNDERVAFFLEHYDENSGEYCYSFRDAYKRYLKNK